MKAAASDRQTSSKPEWFAAWFDSAHYHRLYAYRDQAEAARFIDNLIARGHLSAGAAVLDLGCGSGRHSRYLNAKGFDVTGLDLSAESLKLAKSGEGPHLRFVRQDMRQAFGAGAFDHVVNLFTSFGYFDDEADNLSVVHNIATALKPDGTLVLDYLNLRYAETHLRPDEIVEHGEVMYHLSRWRDAGHIYKRIVVDDPKSATPLEFVERVAALAIEDFRFMFSVCGLEAIATYGDYGLAPFDETSSPRLILVARKVRDGLAARALPGQALADATDGLGRHAEIRGEHQLRHAKRD